MSGIFQIINGNKESKDSPATFSLGIKMKIGHLETICPITESLSKESLEAEIDSLKDELAELLKKLESCSNGTGLSGIDDNASPLEIWQVLSSITDNSILTEQFNSLSESRRRELADYIFANCNMFTGKGAYFSARYEQATGLLSG